LAERRHTAEEPLRVTLDRMARQDVPAIVEIERACFPDPWDRLAFERETENTFSRPLVARDAHGRIVGYIIYWIAGPEFHVLNVAVHPDFRNRGVGRALINRCIADAMSDHAEFVALEVRESNASARALYRSYGFVTIGIRRHYYKDGEDALVLLLHLRTAEA
jgi:ribosomal-protein-alanine N-acetyltransferase